jgi:hypothetical protein
MMSRIVTMSRNRARVTAVLILLGLALLPGGTTSAGWEPEAPAGVISVASPAEFSPGHIVSVADASAAPTVVLRSMTGRTIRFWTQNGRTVDGVRPEARDLPHLVLRRNGTHTDARERTLSFEVTGIEVPPTGVIVTLMVETERGDPDWVGDSPPRISVWRASRSMTNTTDITQTAVAVRFRHTFDASVLAGSRSLAMPTGYFRYELVVSSARRPEAEPLSVSSGEHAFLLENEWIVPLPEVGEASPGVAPDELVVYYADMFPFRRDHRDPATWVPREQVSDYVGHELIPTMVEAFRAQANDWGFPWYPEWTPYRSGAGAERLSVALADDQTWYHGQTLGQGNAEIFVNTNHGLVEYETLTDGLMSTFHHELFHNHQRNIQQHLGGSGRVAGAENSWSFFSEGMAVLASSVGQPEVQFSRTWGARQYLDNARGFLGRQGISQGDLNKSYARMNPYHAVAYWRFLYEQCGGLNGASEDPAAGMGIIRQVLVALYAGGVVDIDAATDLVGHLPAIMDEALQSSSCPFQTHADSLRAFSAAIHALRLEGGRHTGPGSAAGYGFYDPEALYYNPPVSTVAYSGEEVIYSAAEQPHPAGIPSSFGTDVVEVALDAAVDGTALTIAVRGAAGSAAQFQVQLWQIDDGGTGEQIGPQESLEGIEGDGQFVYSVSEIDTTAHSRLSLVITRADAAEGTDPVGAYTIVLSPGV